MPESLRFPGISAQPSELVYTVRGVEIALGLSCSLFEIRGLCGRRALCELPVFHLSCEAFAVAVGYLLPSSIRGLTSDVSVLGLRFETCVLAMSC